MSTTIIGIDPHKESWTAVAVGPRGERIGAVRVILSNHELLEPTRDSNCQNKIAKAQRPTAWRQLAEGQVSALFGVGVKVTDWSEQLEPTPAAKSERLVAHLRNK